METFQNQSTQRRDKWRTRRRFVMSTLVLMLLYLAIQRVWLWGVLQIGRSGYIFNDPAQTYLTEAATVAKESKAREALLGPQFPRDVFELGLFYGYLNQWLGGYGAQPKATIQKLEQPVARELLRMNTLGMAVGIGPVERLPMRTAGDFLKLTQRLEDDDGGIAQRVEKATTQRLRHLFLLGAHVGTELAALETANQIMPIPAAQLIGKHGTLAGVSEGLWRPLARLPSGEKPEAVVAYRAAIKSLENSLLPSNLSRR